MPKTTRVPTDGSGARPGSARSSRAIHAPEAGRHSLSQPGSQARLPDTTHAQQRRHLAVFLQNPGAQGRELVGTADKAKRNQRLAPILDVLVGPGHRWRGSSGLKHLIGRCRWRRRARGEQASEPRVVERSVHPR